MIVALSKLKEATMLVASKRPLAVRYHWCGRSVMCAGRNCPACHLRSPKVIYYFAAHYQKQLRIIEACPSMVNLVDRLASTLCLENWNGIAFEACRSNNRCPWIFKRTDYKPNVAALVPEQDVTLAIANVYRVPPPVQDERFMTWLERVTPAQSEILQKCQLI